MVHATVADGSPQLRWLDNMDARQQSRQNNLAALSRRIGYDERTVCIGQHVCRIFVRQRTARLTPPVAIELEQMDIYACPVGEREPDRSRIA